MKRRLVLLTLRACRVTGEIDPADKAWAESLVGEVKEEVRTAVQTAQRRGLMPKGDANDPWLIPGDFADIQAALASGSVVDGHFLEWSDHTADDGSLLLNISKEIILTYTAAWRSGYAAIGGLDNSPAVAMSAVRVTVLNITANNVTINNPILRHDRFPNARGGLIELDGADNVTIRNPQALTWGHQLSVAPFRAAHPFAIGINSCLNFKIIGGRFFQNQFTQLGNTAEVGAAIEIEASSTGLILNCSILCLSLNAIGSAAEEGAIRLDTSADVTVINTFAHAKPRTGGAVAYTDFHVSGGATFNAPSSNNAATDGSQPGTSGQTLTHHANDTFYCLGAGDGRAIAGGLAAGAGAANADLVGFSDIDGNPWPTTPHIGAWATTVTIPSILSAPFSTPAMDSRTPDRTVMIGDAWGYKTLGEALDCLRFHYDVVVSAGPNVNHCPELELLTAGESVLFLIDGDGGTPRTQDRLMFPTRETAQTNNQKIWVQQIGTRTFKLANPAVKGIWFWQQAIGASPIGQLDIDIAGCTFLDCSPDYGSTLVTPDLTGAWQVAIRCVNFEVNGTVVSFHRFRNNRILNFQQEPTTGLGAGLPFVFGRPQTAQIDLVVELNYLEMDAITAALVISSGVALAFRKTAADMTNAIVRHNTIVGKGLQAAASGLLWLFQETSDGDRRIDIHNNVAYEVAGSHTEMFRPLSQSAFDFANASSDASAPTGTGFVHNLTGAAFVDDSDFEGGGGDFHPSLTGALHDAADVGEASAADIDGNAWIGAANIGALNDSQVIPGPVENQTGAGGGRHEICFTLTDPDSRTGDVTPEFSTDGGRTFSPATVVDPSSILGLTSSPAGIEHCIIWDAEADGFDGNLQNVIFRIESETFGEGESLPFNVQILPGAGSPRMELVAQQLLAADVIGEDELFLFGG